MVIAMKEPAERRLRKLFFNLVADKTADCRTADGSQCTAVGQDCTTDSADTGPDSSIPVTF